MLYRVIVITDSFCASSRETHHQNSRNDNAKPQTEWSSHPYMKEVKQLLHIIISNISLLECQKLQTAFSGLASFQ